MGLTRYLSAFGQRCCDLGWVMLLIPSDCSECRSTVFLKSAILVSALLVAIWCTARAWLVFTIPMS